MAQDNLDIESNHFWHLLLNEKHLLQKKRGISRIAYLLLFKWFQKKAVFPANIKTLHFICISTHTALLS